MFSNSLSSWPSWWHVGGHCGKQIAGMYGSLVWSGWALYILNQLGICGCIYSGGTEKAVHLGCLEITVFQLWMRGGGFVFRHNIFLRLPFGNWKSLITVQKNVHRQQKDFFMWWIYLLTLSVLFSSLRENILVLDIFFEALNYETIEQKKAYEVAALLGK